MWVSLTYKDYLPSGIVRLLTEDRAVSDEERGERTERLVALAFAFAVLLGVCWIYWNGIPASPRYYVGTAVMSLLLLVSLWVALEVETSHTSVQGGTVVFGPWGLVEICSVVLVGPTWATVANIASSVYLGRLDWKRILWDMSGCAIRLHLAALVFGMYSDPLIEGGATVSFGLGATIFGVGLMLETAELSLMSASTRVRYGLSLQTIFREQIKPYILFEGLHLLIAMLVVGLLARNNVAGAIVMLVAGAMATLLAYSVHSGRRENMALKDRLDRLQQRSAEEASAFARVIFRRIGTDEFAAHHAAATARYSYDLARRMKYSEERANQVWLAGLLHNIGLFEHAGLAYSWTEMEEDRSHPARGASVLAGIPGYGEIAKWVLTHHERVDGGGYPGGLPRNWIKQEAQIISIAQAYAGAVLERPGTNGEGGEDPKHVRHRMLLDRESAYEKDVANSFAVMLQNSSGEYQRGQGDGFEFPQSPIDALAGERSGESLHPSQLEMVTDRDAGEYPSETDEQRTRLTGWPTLGEDVSRGYSGEDVTDPQIPSDDGAEDYDGR